MTAKKTWAATIGLTFGLTFGLTLAGGAYAHGGHGTEGHVHDLLAELFGSAQAGPSWTPWLVLGAIAVGLLLARKDR